MQQPAPATPTILRWVLGLVFAGVVIKAASADLTWDEAWTYLFYGRTPLGFTRLDYANDHPLNSILIWASTRMFGNSEFIIRIPNVLAGGLYLYSSAKLIGVVRGKLLAFGLCVLQPYLLDYFALARGYGIAAALVQFGLVAHFFGPKPRPRLMLAACLLASLTVFSTLVVLYALLGSLALTAVIAKIAATRQSSASASAGSLRRDAPRDDGEGRHGPRVAALTALFGLLGLLPIAGLLHVSRDGLPLYGSTAGFFDAIVRGVARMYVPNHWSTLVAVVILLGVSGLLLGDVRSMSARARTLTLASAGALGATWLAARAGGEPLPTGRLLLPFLPLWNLSAIAMAEDIRAASGPLRPRMMRGAGAVLCVALGAVFLYRLHFQRYADWPQDYRLQNRLVRALASGGHCFPPDVWERYGHVYYLERWFPPDRRPPDVQCPQR